MITQSDLRALLSYDTDTGEFRWRKTMGGRSIAGTVAGTRHPKGYTRVIVKQKRYYAHRLAWLYVYGEWPPNLIDHVDGNPGNNAISNLRLATNSDNLANRGPQKNNTSGEKGVWFDKRSCRWCADIWRQGKKTWLGSFETKEAAAMAYRTASMKIAGEFSWLYRGGKL